MSNNNTTHTVECCCTEKNRKVKFFPIDRYLRGRMSQEYVKDNAVAAKLRTEAPAVIPGIHIELTGNRIVLRDPIVTDPTLREWAEKQAKRRGERLPPAEEVIENVNGAECLFWLRTMFNAGKVVPVGCTLPELHEIAYTLPENALAPPPKQGADRKMEIFRKHPDTAAAYVGMTDKQRSEFEALVGI